ncbi:MAG: carboxypeptidase-like regulatory domain-containing protein, partial [Proteiniphilum sp.]|nr:carboxypeptidase-like regulatory domain-containing protein [Proteiniphilum sp.]
MGNIQFTGTIPAESMIDRMERLNELGKHNGQKVSYNVRELNGKNAPPLEVETNNMEEWLHKSLVNSEFTYEKRENNHFLVLRSPEKEAEKIMAPQQQSVVTGRVTDSQFESLIGVNIVEKGTTNGTVTDMDGHFTLSTAPNATIVFSYIGFENLEVARNNRSTIDVVLREDSELLDEVVVVGYGTQKLINLTGAVGVITSQDIVKRPITNVSTGLQGLVPGMTVTASANGGLPGQSNASIQIRGIGSRGNNSPLILIDGAEGDMNIINPNGIESISVLK